MNIQSLVREKVIGNIKTGTKGANGLPQKLPYFNVEEDKATSRDMVEIFKQLYPDKPTKLKIMFTSEDPFNFKYKRYVKGKAVCIGNDTKAITIGKDSKGNNAQIEIECNEQCEQRACGRCKLIGSLKFVLVGIDAGGLWKINTSGGFSLSNIATEIIKFKKAGISIVGVPFELSLTAQESLAYGTYYSIDLKRTDIKPQLTIEMPKQKVLASAKPVEDNNEVIIQDNKRDKKIENHKEVKNTINNEEKQKENYFDYLTVKKLIPTVINKINFSKIIFEDTNSQNVEYLLHPKANQEILKYGEGTVIELLSSKIEMNHNVLCKYNIKQFIDSDGIVKEFNNELKQAV